MQNPLNEAHAAEAAALTALLAAIDDEARCHEAANAAAAALAQHEHDTSAERHRLQHAVGAAHVLIMSVCLSTVAP